MLSRGALHQVSGGWIQDSGGGFPWVITGGGDSEQGSCPQKGYILEPSLLAPNLAFFFLGEIGLPQTLSGDTK